MCPFEFNGLFLLMFAQVFLRLFHPNKNIALLFAAAGCCTSALMAGLLASRGNSECSVADLECYQVSDPVFGLDLKGIFKEK